MAKEERGVYTDMEWWTRVRLEVSREGKKKREVLRDEGIGWETLKKILAYSEPPGYRLKEPRPKPKIGPTWSESLKSSKKTERCQRSNATRSSGSTNASRKWDMRGSTPR